MSEWEKAREAAGAAIESAARYFSDGTMKSPEACVDAALSAFEVHGLVLVPKVPTESMLNAVRNDVMTMAYYDSKAAERDARNAQKYYAMITAALKDRT